MQSNPITSAARPVALPSPRPDDRLEQAFLEEMLKYAGPKPSQQDFGGGIGEDQFSTFLTREYAAILSAALDLGLRIDGEKGE
ncbi:MAG: hypothetical protein ACK5IP_07565 [Paracoccus sp. (in: a-proteobacteria)]